MENIDEANVSIEKEKNNEKIEKKSIISSKKIEKEQKKQEKLKLIEEKKKKNQQKRLEKSQLIEKKKQIKEQKKKEKQDAKILKQEKKREKSKTLKTKNPEVEHQKFLQKAKDREKRLTFMEGRFDLDNAALIYPPARTNNWNAGFRVSALLVDEVKPDILQNALNKTMERFPYYNVSLRRGVFWYYFQSLPDNPKVQLEENYPCATFDFKGDSPIFRVLYYKNKISLEFFHSLGDGFGGLLFLNTILINYFILCGVEIDVKKYFVNPYDIFDVEETEDAFLKYADHSNHKPHKESKGWQVKGTLLEYGQTRVINGIIDTLKLKEKGKEFGASINEFLLATLIYSLVQTKKQAKNKKGTIKVSLPIDCRRFFPSITMRNFSSFKNFELLNEQLEFADIIQFVKDEMAGINKDYLMENINANVYHQVNPFVRIMPLWLKNIILRMCFNAFGENLFTTAFSNLGVIKTPEEFAGLIDRYDVMIGGGKVNGINVATCSYNNKTVITFTRRIKETIVEKTFFRFLSSLGIDIKIETN